MELVLNRITLNITEQNDEAQIALHCKRPVPVQRSVPSDQTYNLQLLFHIKIALHVEEFALDSITSEVHWTTHSQCTSRRNISVCSTPKRRTM